MKNCFNQFESPKYEYICNDCGKRFNELGYNNGYGICPRSKCNSMNITTVKQHDDDERINTHDADLEDRRLGL